MSSPPTHETGAGLTFRTAQMPDGSSGPGTGVLSVTSTSPITVNNTDPQNPIVGEPASNPSPGVFIDGYMSAAQATKLAGLPTAPVVNVQAALPLHVDNTDPQNPIVYEDQADSTTDGFLTAADWNRFDAAASTVYDSPLSHSAGHVLILNSGTTVGRAGLPILIDRQVLAAGSTSYTSPTWAASKYRKIVLELDLGPGAGTPNIRFNGDTGANYFSNGVYTQGATSNNWFGATGFNSATNGTLSILGLGTAAGVDCTGKVEIWPLGRAADNRKRFFFETDMDLAAPTTTSKTTSRGSGYWNNAAAMTALALAFTACSGTVTLWGVPNT